MLLDFSRAMVEALHTFPTWHPPCFCPSAWQGYRHKMLDGSVAMSERQKLVDDFNREPSLFIFLISTLAGGW